jgi:predicted extracellular nuclease
MLHRSHALLAIVSLSATASVVACSSGSSKGSPGGSPEAGADTGTGSDGGGGGNEGGAEGGDSGATMTIAQARSTMPTTPVTLVGIVTAAHGATGDQPVWYIEDPAGGAGSGIAVYCDPVLTTCPKGIAAQPIGTKVAVTGVVSTYMGQVQIAPTAQTVVATNVALPPAATVTMADVAPGGTSQYLGVYVKLTAAKLTVDSVTPQALYDTQCATTVADGGAADAGPTMCTGCAPPTYSGFQANDGSGNEIYVEDFFFNSDPLQSSPECLTQPGVVAVSVGMTFSKMAGILDYDGYAKAQDLMPVQPSDYQTP